MRTEKQREYARLHSRKWRKEHPGYYKEYLKKWRKENKGTELRYRQKNKGAIDQLKTGPCSDCYQTFPPCAMDFDHVKDRKKKDVSAMKSHSLKAIVAEIKKCDLVCSNCHRIRTWRRKVEGRLYTL